MDAKHKVLSDQVNAAEGIDDQTKADIIKSLSEFVTVGTTDEQVKALADRELEHANKEAAHKTLSEMGFPVNTPAGRVHISATPSTEAAKLQAIQHEQLRSTSAYLNGDIRLSEDKDLPLFTQLSLSHISIALVSR